MYSAALLRRTKTRYQTQHKETRFSFDMLGEGARTEADAAEYLKAYSTAIDEIGKTIQPLAIQCLRPTASQ